MRTYLPAGGKDLFEDCPNCGREKLKTIGIDWSERQGAPLADLVFYHECQWCGEEYTSTFFGDRKRIE